MPRTAVCNEESVGHGRALRQQADRLSGADATTAELQRASALLEEAQRYLGEAAQTTGNPVLLTEGYNNLIPLAAIYSRQGRKEEALTALEQANGVAYLRIDHFTDDSGLKAFEAALPQILTARALIIDMRRNGGGNGEIGYKILSYLTRKPITGATSYVRGETAYLRLLRGLTLGESTGGSTGQAINFQLPGGGTARVCGKRDVFPDGREFVGIGVAPQIEVRQTVAGLRAGRDPVLDRALAELAAAGKREFTV